MSIQKLFEFLSASLLVLTFLAGCSKNEGDKKTSKGDVFGIAGIKSGLHVSDASGKPISNAQILIGDAVNSPFVSNFLTTDAQGSFNAPAAWTSEQVITIAAPGFVRASYFGQIPQGQTFQLRPSQSTGNFELKGQGVGFDTKDGDNLVDFALAMPTITHEALLSFDMSLFISPLNDELSVYNQKLQIPSNVMLPKQKEKYGILPVTLEKPIYRTYFSTLGSKQVLAARGQFPFKEVVKELQSNTPFVKLVNYFTLLGGSLRRIDISGPTQNLDLPVNELLFNQSRTFKSSVFGSDQYMLAIPLSSYQNQLIPTDIKNVPANTSLKMTTAAGSEPQILVVMKKTNDVSSTNVGNLTAAMIPFEENVAPVLIPMIEDPTVIDISEIRVNLPVTPNGVVGGIMYSLLSQVESRTQDQVKFDVVTKLWEVYSPSWQSEVKLPTWPKDSAIPGKKRWEVTLTGSSGKGGGNKMIDLSPRFLENVTHATHGSSDF